MLLVAEWNPHAMPSYLSIFSSAHREWSKSDELDGLDESRIMADTKPRRKITAETWITWTKNPLSNPLDKYLGLLSLLSNTKYLYTIIHSFIEVLDVFGCFWCIVSSHILPQHGTPRHPRLDHFFLTIPRTSWPSTTPMKTRGWLSMALSLTWTRSRASMIIWSWCHHDAIGSWQYIMAVFKGTVWLLFSASWVLGLSFK